MILIHVLRITLTCPVLSSMSGYDQLGCERSPFFCYKFRASSRKLVSLSDRPSEDLCRRNSLGLTFSQRAVLSLPQLSRTLIECLTKHRRERTGDNVPRFETVSIRFPRSSSPTASLALCTSTAPLPVIGGVAAVVCYSLPAGMASRCALHALESCLRLNTKDRRHAPRAS